MERESPRYRLVEANSTGGQGSRKAVEPGGGGNVKQFRLVLNNFLWLNYFIHWMNIVIAIMSKILVDYVYIYIFYFCNKLHMKHYFSKSIMPNKMIFCLGNYPASG
jgi:hypothetical protein